MDTKENQGTLYRVRKELEIIAEADYKKFSASLIPGVENLLGIRIPILRNMAKKLAKEDWKGCMEWEDTVYFEEIMLQGLVLGYAKAPVEEILEYARKFIPKIDNWSINDSFCSNFKIARKEPQKVWDFLMTYKDSRDEFKIRVVAVMLMNHFLNDDHIDDVLKVLGELEIVGYYTSMGVAWAYATAWAKYPEKTKSYLKEHPIEPETYHKTLRKCLESYRISDKDKNWIRSEELSKYRKNAPRGCAKIVPQFLRLTEELMK